MSEAPLYTLHPEPFTLSPVLGAWYRSFSRRWRSTPFGKCSQERLTRGTVTSTMRKAAHPSGCARCGAGAGCSAMEKTNPASCTPQRSTWSGADGATRGRELAFYKTRSSISKSQVTSFFQALIDSGFGEVSQEEKVALQGTDPESNIN